MKALAPSQFVCSVVLTLVSVAMGFRTTSEGIDPFNRFLTAGIGNVAAFIGASTYSLPLMRVAGRGQEVELYLRYSSNIATNVRSRNDIAPARWCGLGWHLGVGGIACDPRQTKTHEDDRFGWWSPDGVYSEILKKDGAYYIEDKPFVKVEAISNSEGVYKGWRVTQADGSVYLYGDCDFDDDRKATRHVFSWGEYVGPGFEGTPSLYPVFWDLSQKKDTWGNAIDYYHWQNTEPVVLYKDDGGIKWNSSVEYTKESYLDKIKNSEGMQVILERERKTDEPIDPYIYRAEPDGFMEFYESYRLKRLKVFPGENQTPSQVIDLNYSSINADPGQLGNEYRKSILKSVVYKNGDESKVLNEVHFDYNTDFDRADNLHSRYDENYHYGALSKVQDYNGKTTTYQYKRREVDADAYLKDEPVIDHGGLPLEAAMGTLDNGNPYSVVVSGEYHHEVTVKHWDGARWRESVVCMIKKTCEGGLFTRLALTEDDMETHRLPVNIYPGNNYFVARGGHHADRIWVFNWDGERWVEEIRFTYVDDVYNKKKVVIGDGYFVLQRGGNNESITVFNWDGESWARTDIGNLGGVNTKGVQAGNNYILISGGGVMDYFWVYSWDGQEWTNTVAKTNLGSAAAKFYRAGRDYFVVSTGGNQEELRAYRWNGTIWAHTNLGTLNDSHGKHVTAGENYFVARGGGKKEMVYAFNWNGDKWIQTLEQTNLDDENTKAVWCGSEYFIATRGGKKEAISLLRMNGASWELDKDVSGNLPGTPDLTVKHAYLRADYFVLAGDHPFKDNPADNGYGYWFYSWDGRKFKTPPYYLVEDEPNHLPYSSLAGAGSGFLFLVNIYDAHGESVYDRTRITRFFKFQDEVDKLPYAYVVSNHQVDGGVGSEVAPRTYSYSQGNFESEAGIPKFGEVSVTSDKMGTHKSWYFNGLPEQADKDPEYEDLEGFVYRTEALNENGMQISSGKTDYDTYKSSSWPVTVHQKRFCKKETVNDGVSSQSESKYNTNDLYDIKNGLPRLSIKTAPNDKKLQTFQLFAHEIDDYKSSLESAYMMSQGAMNLTLEDYSFNEISAKDWYKAISKEHIRGATVTTWGSAPGAEEIWAPKSTYVWRSNMDGEGIPVSDFKSFDFSNEAANRDNGWLWTGGVARYNAHGQVLQSKSPGAGGVLNTSTIYRSDFSRSIATIVNAEYLECAAYTCDYDIAEGAYLDRGNGWERSGAVVKDCPVSFVGDKAVYVDLPVGSGKFGPTREVAILENTDYIMSAWVLVEQGTLRMHGDYRKRTAGGELPISAGGKEEDFSVQAATVTASTEPKWEYIELRIPASDDLSGLWSDGTLWAARVYVGSPNGVKAYIQDIRFFPADAQMTTTYYDPMWKKALVAVDANGKPGVRVICDTFGRPVEWHKPIFQNGAVQEWKKISDQEYRLACDNLCTIWPTEDVVVPGKEYEIMWTGGEMVKANGVILAYTIDNGVNWTQINTESTINGSDQQWGNYAWKIPEFEDLAEETILRIKITDSAMPTVYVISDPCEVYSE